MHAEIAEMNDETLAAWDGKPLGRFAVLATDAEDVQAVPAGECPLCSGQLLHLFAKGGRFGRTVAEAREGILVDVMPDDIDALACQECDVVFYEPKR